jgi:hypothetical protein
MADGGIGAAGLALAVPGVVDLFCKYGVWIAGRAATFKNAEKVWAELGIFGHSLSAGKLKMDIQLAKHIYDSDGCDTELKKSLEDQVDRLAREVDGVKIFLEKQDVGSMIGRGIFAISGERRVKEFNKALSQHQRELSELLILEDVGKRRLPDQILLSQSRFQYNESQGYWTVPFTSNLFLAQADYKEDTSHSQPREMSVLVERHDENLLEEDFREIASLLHFRLSRETMNKGILNCLGYRMDPNPELLFELPKDTSPPQTLQTLITVDAGKINGGNHPLDFRFRLARQIGEAVLKVHSANLVHKNIRTETILVLQRTAPDADEDTKNAIGFGEPYLTNWCLLRKASNLTSKRGTSDWTANIYRHPERQGLQVQQRYNIGHDIYSLGVCLLEIGLWDPLILTRTADGKPQVSELFRAAAKVELSDDPDSDLKKKIQRPVDVKRILVDLAKQELSQRMGIGYKGLVIACLTCLDHPSGFGKEVDFRTFNRTQGGVAFKELVLSFFAEISIS